jgi:hypothetical protein
LFRTWRGLQLDDWIMGVFVTPVYTTMIVLANKWLKVQSNLLPPDYDFGSLSPEELSSRRLGSKYVVVVEQTQIATLWACKACLLIFYWRITRTAQRRENIAIKILAVYVAVGFVVIEILYFAAWCRPFEGYFTIPPANVQCVTLVHHRIVKAVFNISSDLIMLSIALQMLIRSLLPLKRKLVLCGIFSLGLFVVAASILNSCYSFIEPYKQTWIYWYVREDSTAILVANLPFTWTLLRNIFEVGDFDENNPPAPWTYHSARTGAGRRTAQLSHHTNTMKTHSHTAGTHQSSTSSHYSGLTNAATLVGTRSDGKRLSDPSNTPRSETSNEMLDKTVHPYDFALAPSSSGGRNPFDSDLEHGTGLMDVGGLLDRNSLSHNASPKKAHSSAPRITEDGTGGFYINNRPISPPSRALLAASHHREVSPLGTERRPISPTYSHRRDSLDSIDELEGIRPGGGRSARDRRARARLSRDMHTHT